MSKRRTEEPSKRYCILAQNCQDLLNTKLEIKCVAKTNLTRNGFRRHKVDDKHQQEEHERRNHYFGFGDWFNQTYGIPAEQMSDLDEGPTKTHMPWELIAHEH